ncbi:MAG: hypothetical protein RRZ65_08690 [Tannerellaceae bacterium]
MEANKNSKTEASASVDEVAKESKQALNSKKVFVSKDGYVFAQECDARAYVGKDGEYSTVTDGTSLSVNEGVVNIMDNIINQAFTLDSAIDKHGHIDSIDGN